MKAVGSEIITAYIPRVKEPHIPFWKYTTGQYKPTQNQWDICYKYEYPYNILCNFTPSHFVFDGIEIDSMEGFLQALKVADPQVQRKICTLPGFLAKKLGNYLKRSGKFDREHLYWNGKQYSRYSPEYQELLRKAYDAKFEQDKTFRHVLDLSKGHRLTHDIGKTDPNDTVLTEAEFITNLEALRNKRHKITILEFLTEKVKRPNSQPQNPVAVAQAFNDIKTSSINGHFICGEPLFNNGKLKFLDKKLGIHNIIDINVNNELAQVREIVCRRRGLGYINITTDSLADTDTIKKLITMYNSGEFSYICCVERPDANIPLALNYLFNPKADISDAIIFGTPRRNFISMMKKIGGQIYSQEQASKTPEISDKKSFIEKLKILTELN